MTSQRRPSAVPKLALKAEPISRQKLRLWLRLLKTSRAVEAELRERLRVNFGTTLPKFDVMAALERDPDGLTMTELSRFLMVSNGNVTGIVDRLVAEGLVVRRAHEQDRRSTFVRLTAKGTRQFAAMAKAHEAWIAEILAHITVEEAQSIMALLSRSAPQHRRLAAIEN
jgi:DNA-binding MarR family transcriptional regulator